MRILHTTDSSKILNIQDIKFESLTNYQMADHNDLKRSEKL